MVIAGLDELIAHQQKRLVGDVIRSFDSYRYELGYLRGLLRARAQLMGEDENEGSDI